MKPLCLPCVVSFLLSASAVTAPCAPLREFTYHEGFEVVAPQVELWARNGDSQVAVLQPTEERAFEGKRSLKLDVTLQGGSYHYWGVPVRVPCVEGLKLSARVFIGPETTCPVGFGTNMVYPPTHHSGCGPIRTFDKPTEGWELVEGDLGTIGRQTASSVMGTYTTSVKVEDVGIYLDRWSIFVYGGAGQRAVVYVDDVRIEGQTPTEEDYEADIKQRWQRYLEGFAPRLEELRQLANAAKKALAALAVSSEDTRGVAAAARAAADQAVALAEQVNARGYYSAAEAEQIRNAMALAEQAPATIAAVEQARAAGQSFIVHTPPAITNERLATDHLPVAPVGAQIHCSGCRGEYESVTAAVWAFRDLKNLRVTVTELTGTAGVIPSRAVDVRVVKWWYQAGKEIWDRTHKQLVPELLLKDDGLVRVDAQEQANYLRSTAPDGAEEYLLCSGPTSDNLANVRPVDARTLQPVDVPANSLKQFWLTVHIPEKAAAGEYRGEVIFTADSAEVRLPLVVTVHPFDLEPPRLIYSIYYRATLSPDGQPTIGSELKSEQQYRAEIEDMKAHGVLYPTNYQGWDERLLRTVLDIRREAGLPTERFFNLGRGTGNSDTPEGLAALQRDVIQWLRLCQEYGYQEIYFYGIDEATGDLLKSQEAAWNAVQRAGGKTFVACYQGTFEAMGSLLNCAVLAGRPDPAEAKKWHSVSSLAFCYAFPQVGNEEPLTYRRNFGLVLWKADFDGAMDYAYQHGFTHIWNDFDDPSYRDHNFTYPTINGVVDTIQWEGFREGVDDVRYMTTLEHALDAAPPERAEIVAQARQWLRSLDPETADLDAVRAQMVEWIEKVR